MSDPKKRERYDKYGDDGEGEGGVTSDEWFTAYEYYRAMHPEIQKKDIKSFSERYRHSEEEQQDLLEFYDSNKGNIKNILECIMCSQNDDVARFVEFYE